MSLWGSINVLKTWRLGQNQNRAHCVGQWKVLKKHTSSPQPSWTPQGCHQLWKRSGQQTPAANIKKPRKGDVHFCPNIPDGETVWRGKGWLYWQVWCAIHCLNYPWLHYVHGMASMYMISFSPVMFCTILPVQLNSSCPSSFCCIYYTQFVYSYSLIILSSI